jgi:nitrile hydratase
VNGVHDLGGMQGMGPIPYEKDEPVFHEPWEGRVYALSRALRAWRLWTLDHSRQSIERLPQDDYLHMRYYERWFASSLHLALTHAMITEEEVRTGRAAPGSTRATPALDATRAAATPSRGMPSAVDPAIKPRFRVDQRVHTRNLNPAGHTRLPRYARDKQGTIVRDHGVYSFPDTVAQDLGEKRQHLYAVRFTARELWGDTAPARDTVHLDLFEDYLERV